MSDATADERALPSAAGCGLVGPATPGLWDSLNEPLFPEKHNSEYAHVFH